MIVQIFIILDAHNARAATSPAAVEVAMRSVGGAAVPAVGADDADDANGDDDEGLGAYTLSSIGGSVTMNSSPVRTRRNVNERKPAAREFLEQTIA